MSKKILLTPRIKKALEISISLDLPALLEGETGTGKTTFIRELAREKGKTLYRINLTGQTGVDELIGKWIVNQKEGMKWIDGLLVLAMKQGDWVVLDEVNMALPEILAKLHSLLDDDKKLVLIEKEGEEIIPHPDFRFFATQNPSEDYAGTKELNKAFLSRFPLVIRVDYTTQEAKLLTEVSEDTAIKLVEIAREIRKSKERGDISLTCSTRDIIYASKLIKGGMTLPEALEVSVINKAPQEEKKAIEKMIEIFSGEKIIIDGVEYESLKDVLKLVEDLKKEVMLLKEAN
jgi:midasin (ATPase involved in ribosome maturation)